jgi:hypothetical protein
MPDGSDHIFADAEKNRGLVEREKIPPFADAVDPLWQPGISKRKAFMAAKAMPLQNDLLPSVSTDLDVRTV